MSGKHRVFILDSAEVPHSDEDDIERAVLGEFAEVHTALLHSEADFFDRWSMGTHYWFQRTGSAITYSKCPSM